MQPSMAQMRALAFVYDNLNNFPVWMQKLAPGQLTQLAKVLIDWAAADSPSSRIVPLQETQKREVIRAVIACQGDLRAAAKALGIGKTTIYRLLHRWDLSKADWRLFVQARSLAEGTFTAGAQTFDTLAAAPALSTPITLIGHETRVNPTRSNAGRSK